jgi:hypothetical protein
MPDSRRASDDNGSTRERWGREHQYVPMSKRHPAQNLPAAPPERQTKTTAKNGTREQDMDDIGARLRLQNGSWSMGTTARTWISSHRPSSQCRAHSSNPGKPALQRRHHYHRERPWQCVSCGDRSVVVNETMTLGYGRLTAWHCLYDNGSNCEGVGDESNSALLRETVSERANSSTV